ncbi:SDR family NAD(P)-dependent oxidoreductase [Sorangium sp. So ce1078]|uniref:SDR family NAD(P)-dependent oxidoreductase n=1 Tax=Sorangium sp. So ce1078 TaxID=3133329 RepID=UPI003F5F2603
MSHSLQDKVAVVTGGSTGIGLGIAKRLISEGAFVYITGRRQAELDEAVRSLGSQAAGVRADASRLDDLDALYERIRSERGVLHIVVANAGGGELVPLGNITEEHFDKTFGTNVKGVLFTVQKALPLLGPGASIILIGSTTSIKGTGAFSVYSASKAAVRSFARNWILDLKGRDIRVNVLSPGPVNTPGLLGVIQGENQEAILNDFIAQIPLGRIGDPDEIGKIAVFLASDASSFIHGVELFADGGLAQV